MKNFQLKYLGITSSLFFLVVSLNMYLQRQTKIRWEEEIFSIVCEERLLDSIDRQNVKTMNQLPLELIKSVANDYHSERPRRVRADQIGQVLNINTATREKLMGLPGIGEVLSQRIIKFRSKLGGFHSVQQLKDVYGLPEETFEHLESRLKCEGEIQKLHLEQNDFKMLLKHPYLSYEDVKAIKNYLRKKQIDSMETLKTVTKKDSAWTVKVWPYVDN